MVLSTSTIQLRGHLNPNSAATSPLGTKKLKVVRGDRLDYQCTLVDLILNILASGGEPSPSTMAIVMEDGVTKSRPCSNSAASVCIQPRLSRISLHRDHFSSVLVRSNLALSQQLRKARNIVVSGSSNSVSSSDNSSSVTNNSDSVEYDNIDTFTELEQMENNDRTLKELATPDVVYQPWCIQYPQLEPAQTYELKSGLINLLPKFHGLAVEDPHKHLKEFHVVYSTMRPQGMPEDYIKMKAFPFSLDGATKDWLYLQPVLFSTWGDMKLMFLEKLFPTSRTMTIRKEICGIRQHPRETLHEYWERFNKLCTTCPHHQISEQLLIQYFYEGLSMMDRSMIDAASGGAFMDKTPFGIRGPSQARKVNEIGTASNLRLENQLTELTSLVRQLAVGQHQPTITAKVCGICTFVEHPNNLCPMLQETESNQPKNVGAIRGYQLSTADSIVSSTTFPATTATKNATTRQFSISGGPDELANTVSQLQSVGSSNLPSQTIPNPRGNASVVTLRSGKELPQSTLQQLPRTTEVDSKLNADSQSRPEKTIPFSFPTRTISARKPESDEELLKMFRKVEINIPLLDAIKKGNHLDSWETIPMTARTKIDVHAGTLSMEFGDTLVQFNIFEAIEHPTEDHSLFGIDLIDELVEEYLQLDSISEDSENFARTTDLISCLRSITKEADYEVVHDLPNSKGNNNDIADLDFEAKLFKVLDQVCNLENLGCTNKAKVKVAKTKELFSL
ncbi:hypothetical protein CR513_05631, partial [Mucuna pruriens]